MPVIDPEVFVCDFVPFLLHEAGLTTLATDVSNLRNFARQVPVKTSYHRRGKIIDRELGDVIRRFMPLQDDPGCLPHVFTYPGMAVYRAFGHKAGWTDEVGYTYVYKTIEDLREYPLVSTSFLQVPRVELVRKFSPAWGVVADTYDSEASMFDVLHEHPLPEPRASLSVDGAVRVLAPWVLVMTWGEGRTAKALSDLPEITDVNSDQANEARRIAVGALFGKKFKHPNRLNAGYEDWTPRQTTRFEISHIGATILQLLDGPQREENIRQEAKSLLNRGLWYSTFEGTDKLQDALFDDFFGLGPELNSLDFTYKDFYGETLTGRRTKTTAHTIERSGLEKSPGDRSPN